MPCYTSPRRCRYPYCSCPDDRPDWRDPQMPVLRDYRMSDGTIRTRVDPDYEHRYREFLMTISEQPDFRHDPTYDLKKQRKRV